MNVYLQGEGLRVLPRYALILCGFMLNLAVSMAQPAMDYGFDMLNDQKYEEAEAFFTKVLEEYPQNKTAKICLGRAVGLKGNPEDALRIFRELAETYPGDLEIDLNLAEAFMWQKNSVEALTIYNNILDNYPKEKTALLGRSNALASLTRYVDAVKSIDAAIKVDPENQQMRLSRKFIYLARADELRKDGLTDDAHDLINAVLNDYPNDEQALFDRVTTYLFEQKYRQARVQLLDMRQHTTQKERLMSSLAYASLLVNRLDDFLTYNDSALQYQTQIGTEHMALSLSRARALQLNNRNQEAMDLLSNLKTEYPDSLIIDFTRAQLTLWSGKRARALDLMEDLYSRDSLSFEIAMGLAEARQAVQMKREALKAVRKAIRIQPFSPDARRMAETLENELRPNIYGAFTSSSDKGGNSSTEYAVSMDYLPADKWKVQGNIRRRTTFTDTDSGDLSHDRASFRLEWQALADLALSSQFGYNQVNGEENGPSSHLTGEWGLRLNPGNHHSFNFSFNKGILDYNSSLLAERIQTNDWKAIYHYYSPKRFGVYNQLIWTTQSDGNRRLLYYGSAYYNLWMYPVVQVAFNFNTFSYDNRRPDVYFSPDKFRSFEIMCKVDNAIIKGTSWRYLVTVATGYQLIDDNDGQITIRTDANLSYEITKRIHASLQFLYSSAAQSTSAGFTYRHIKAGITVAL